MLIFRQRLRRRCWLTLRYFAFMPPYAISAADYFAAAIDILSHFR